MSLSERFGERVAWIQDEILRQSAKGTVDQVRARLFDQGALYQKTAKRGVGLRVAVAAAACLAVLLGVLLLADSPGPLIIEMGEEGKRIAPGDWISTPSDLSVPLKFSDGSKVTLAPSTGARIVDVDANGARILLERGTARLEVAHRPKTSWKLEVGPYTVTVIGTVFETSWDPGKKTLVIEQEEGSVRVRGPMVAMGRHLSPGETFRSWVAQERMEIASANGALPEEQPPETADSEIEETVEEPVVEPAKETAAPKRQPRIKPTKKRVALARTEKRGPSWNALAKDGKLDAILADADKQGFDKVISSATATNLMLLGDAARLSRQWKRADQAYRAVRQRYPGTKTASAAAFALGRMSFDQYRRYEPAARWFERYLNEQKEGTLVREAKGRLMEARHRSGDVLAARRAATQYLIRYPGGPHAPFAEKLLKKGKD